MRSSIPISIVTNLSLATIFVIVNKLAVSKGYEESFVAYSIIYGLITILVNAVLTQKNSTLFLKFLILLTTLGAIIGLFWFPQTEGRAANLDLVNIYMDPFLIFIYIASIPFFAGLHQGFKLLNIIDANNIYSQNTVDALKNIKYDSLSLIGFIALAILYIHVFVQGEDPAGPTALGILLSFATTVIATTASVLQKRVQCAVSGK